MRKLFALEDNDEPKSNELIIDKLLEASKEKPSPLSLTADLLKQRSQVNKDVEEHLEEQEEEEEQESEEEGSDNEEDSDEEDDSESDDDDDDEEESDEDDSKSEKEEENAADDEEDLKGLVGSGLGDKDDSKSEKKEESTATESFKEKNSPKVKAVKPTFKNIFEPIFAAHNRYRSNMLAYGLESESVRPEEQPVAYVKEEIVKSLGNLTTLANNYVENTQSSVETYTKSIVKINESLTVFNKMIEEGRFHFTHKLVKDRDILGSIGFPGSSDPRETLRVLSKYLSEANSASALVTNNEFSSIRNAYLAKGFKEENGVITYGKTLPGFLNIGVSVIPYESYTKTNINEYHYYEIKSLKLEDLYGLSAISITDEPELEYIVKGLNDLVIQAGISTDTLKGINENFNTFVNELKVLAYDVENGKYSNMAELGIDNKIQDFIRFKLVTEACFINISLIVKYITSMTSVLNICLELKE